ncbi:MAG: RNase adapter RapZ [Acidobacteriota bacterium]
MKPSELHSLVIVTGMSGSGKHTAFKAFEDLGYFCVDNLPTSLIPRLIQMSKASGGKIRKLAIVVDIRLGEALPDTDGLASQLKQLSGDATIIFVDATDEILARRYSETRRVHPLAHDQSLLEGIREERRRLSDIRGVADLVIDSAEFSVHDLRNFIYEKFQGEIQADRLIVSLVSFGYKYGIPHNSDMAFDVRFLPNPNFINRLKTKTGNDKAVADYVKKHKETEEILARIHDMLEYLLPRFAQEGKKYLTVSIGCTGGKHRSVVVANELKRRLENKHHKVNLVHRDLHNE